MCVCAMAVWDDRGAVQREDNFGHILFSSKGNVPHPWPVFLALVFLHFFLLIGVVCWVFTHCPIQDMGMVRTMFYRQWQRLVKSGNFHCLYFVGSIASKKDWELPHQDPVASTQTHGMLSTTASFFWPCVPREAADFVQIWQKQYKRITEKVSLHDRVWGDRADHG